MALQIIDGRKFNWKAGKGTSEASDLRFNGWPQSFYILSHVSGAQKLFLMDPDSVKRDGDGDIQSVDYFNPGGGIIVTVFND